MKSTVTPATEPNRPVQARPHGRWWLAGAILVVTWSCIRFPQASISGSFDPSLAAVLVFAHEHGLQFGREITCTYGPLGFLSFEFFTPETGVVRIFFELIVAALVGTGLCLAAWRVPLHWRLVALGYFVIFASTERWGGAALYLDLGIFLWGWLCFLEQGQRRNLFVAAFSVLAAAAALVKFSFLLQASFSIILVTSNFVLRRQFMTAVGLLAGFVVVFAAGWLLLGQKLSQIPPYFAISLDIARSYNQSAGSASIDSGWLLSMTLSALAAAGIRICGRPAADRTEMWRRALLLLWLAGLIFTEWKYSCVRNDWSHVAIPAGVVPVMAVFTQAVPAVRKAALASGTVAVVCVATPLLFVQSQIEGPVLIGHVRQLFHNMANNFSALAQPASYLRKNRELFEIEKKHEQLPRMQAAIGNATVDVFGQSQAVAILNEFNYRPRPFFQSYAANSVEAMKWNERYYQSDVAPEYVIFKLEPLDERFSALEDARVLRELLTNYGLAGEEGGYLLLHKRESAKLHPVLIKEGNLHVGEKMDLRAFSGAKLWLEVELRPTLYGRLRTFLLRPSEIRLAAWTISDPQTPRKSQAPASMLSAGFLARPLILNDADARSFWSGASGSELDALSVETDTDPLAAWQKEIHFRVYRLE